MYRNIFDKRAVYINEFEKCQQISKTSYSYVYKIKNKETGDFYVAKILDCYDDANLCNKIITLMIPKIMNIHHPTILTYKWYSKFDFQGENNVILITEFASNGSLSNLLQKNEKPSNFTNTTRQKIIAGIARGMKYLHDHNILHSNLKPSNILLDDKFQPLITDIFPSKIYESDYLSSQFFSLESLPYKAPEVFLNYNNNDKKSDVYSFSILMYEIVADRKAFPEIERGEILDFEFRNKIVNEKYRPKFNTKVNRSLQLLIEKCWSDDPNKRPSFDEIYIKLSKKNDQKSDNCFLDGVDDFEFNSYIEKIETKVIDQEEDELMNKLTSFEEENQKLKETLNQLKIEKKIQFEKIESIEEKFKINKKINEELKLQNMKQTEKIEIIEKNYENLENQLKQLITESLSLNDELSTIEKVHQEIESDLNELKNRRKNQNPENLLISDFNGLPLKSQQKVTENLSKISSFKMSQIFDKLNQLNLFLLKFDEITESCNEIISDQNMKLKEINDNFRIQIRSYAIENLFNNKMVTSPDFLNILSQLDHISIELKYPSKSFNSIYENILNIKNQQQTNQIKISLFISGIEETDTTFCEDKNISFVKLDSNVKSIKGFNGEDKSSFYCCSSLEKITIPSSVTKIGEYAFSGCSMMKEVIIPSSVNSIENGLFFKCSSLEQIRIQSSIKTIGNFAFFRCASLKQIKIPSSVTSIGEYAFSGCSSLKRITIPHSITSIEFGAFFRCSSLEEINLPASVKSIGFYAFYECDALKQIKIPSNATLIEDNSFQKTTIIIRN